MRDLTMSARRAHLFISGRVQGVWYRESTRQEAERLGLDGWVRNLADGRVEAVVEGEPGLVAQLLAWCHEGPRLARVSDVAVTWEPAEGLRGFRVTR